MPVHYRVKGDWSQIHHMVNTEGQPHIYPTASSVTIQLNMHVFGMSVGMPFQKKAFQHIGQNLLCKVQVRIPTWFLYLFNQSRMTY